MTTHIVLTPCKLCGSPSEVAERPVWKAMAKFVRCTGCGAEQPIGTYPDTCELAWNANAVDRPEGESPA